MSSGASGGNTTISGGRVTATGGQYGAGIGGGGGDGNPGGSGGAITVSGGTVTAKGGENGAGIGGGYTVIRGGNGGTVVISGGSILATGSNGGANIGGSLNASSQGSLKNEAGDAVYLTTLRLLGSGTGNAAVSSLTTDSAYAYGVRDVFSDSLGWLSTPPQPRVGR